MSVGWWLEKLIVGLQIFLIVRSIKLRSKIPITLSSPCQIRMISPSRVIGIGIRIIPHSRESSIHLLCRKIRELPIGGTISHVMCYARAE